MCSQSVRTKCYVIRVQKGEKQTIHPCNGALQRWVINLTVKSQTTTEPHSRQGWSIPSSKKCQGAVSYNCGNPGDSKRRGQRADCARLPTKHLSLLVLTPWLNTHQFLLLVVFHTPTQSLSWPLFMCRSVRRIRGDLKQNPVVHLSGSPLHSPLPVIHRAYKNWRWNCSRP